MKKSDEYFLEAFRQNFEALGRSALPLALYGIGEKSQLLLKNISGFNIIGLLDRDTIGKSLYGYPVLSEAEAAELVRAIIIVANMSVAPLIYRRISHLKSQYGISIFYINGTIPDDVTENRFDSELPDSSLEGLKRAIDGSEVVSFDLFDTLITRQVLLPTDIFAITERTLRESHGYDIAFKELRIAAEKKCYRESDRYCNIHDIYKILQKELACSDEALDEIKRAEFAAELRFSAPRSSVLSWYQYALQQDKTVLITTDSFLTEDYILQLLARNGIKGYHHLLISCEERKLKYIGDMWQHVAERFQGRKILHIGDNPLTDVEMAERYPIKTFRLSSVYELISESPLGKMLISDRSVDDSILLGRIAARYFDNLLNGSGSGRRVRIDNMFDLGYLSMGPLVLSYLTWLIQRSQESGIGKLLFFARDGYLLQRLYRKLVKAGAPDAPLDIYFLTSRRAASVAAIRTSYDIAFIIRNICKIKKISFGQLLFRAFGVEADSDDPFAGTFCFDMEEGELEAHILNRYADRIFSNAETERINYLTYINSLGLRGSDPVGCINFVGRGITQYCVSGILGRRLKGFYFARELDMLDIGELSEDCYSLYPDYLSPHISRSNLATRFIFGEVLLTSPDEQLLNFDSNGNPVFEQPKQKRDFAAIAECHKGIERFVEDMQALDDKLPCRSYNLELIDRLYGIIGSGDFICSDAVNRSFCFSDYYNTEVTDLKPGAA